MEGETQTLFVACPGRDLLVLVTNTPAALLWAESTQKPGNTKTNSIISTNTDNNKDPAQTNAAQG